MKNVFKLFFSTYHFTHGSRCLRNFRVPSQCVVLNDDATSVGGTDALQDKRCVFFLVATAFLRSQSHRMGMQPIYLQQSTQNSIAVKENRNMGTLPFTSVQPIAHCMRLKKTQSKSERIATCERTFRM